MLCYAITIFLSAFLLFQVQLVIARYILPWFGGTPAVWTTCMLFFQVLLMGGYAYSHGVVRRLRPPRQAVLHVVLLAASLGVLAVQAWTWPAPLLPGAWWKPTGSAWPVAHILGLLAVAVGLPYFLLSTTSSLLQAWFARAYPGRSPYRLYALSNFGSLLGLATYPFLVEPALTLRGQAGSWAAGYGAFALCCIGCAVRAGRTTQEAPENAPAAVPVAGAPEITAGGRVLWVLLPVCSSVLLLATTNVISEEVAVVPFLWVLPLMLYLLSFIVCFDRPRWYWRPLFVALGVAAMGAVGIAAAVPVSRMGLGVEVGAYSFALFVSCMICHGELVRLRPPLRHLTSYYLSIAMGGAAGGALVALAAPRWFAGLWELDLGYLSCGLLFVAAMLRDPRSALRGRWRRPWQFASGFLLAVLAMGMVLHVERFQRDAVASRRNFYGIVRVQERDRGDPAKHRYLLLHGRTTHGLQLLDPKRRREPTTYFTEESGVGRAILHHPRRRAAGGLRVGVVGLGAGTLAAYGRQGDVFRFYEINPAVVELARGPGQYFSYLDDTPARIEVVLGDARLALERELREGRPQRFDLLVLDAFSGDSPPVHLLTCEAFAVYRRHLREGGVLAVHVSNRYLDLEPVVWRAADEFDLDGVIIRTESDGDLMYGSDWILLSRDRAFLELPAIAGAAGARHDRRVRLWTDDYSNLLGALR